MLSSIIREGLIQYDEITTEQKEKVESDNSSVQEVCMWSNFVKWSSKVDEESAPSSADPKNERWWAGESEEVKEANSIASYSLHTQIILDAVMESIRLGGAKVKVKST